MKNVQELRTVEVRKLNTDAEKARKHLIDEIAKLAHSGKKNSNTTKKLRRDIAQIETVINEKVSDQVEGK